MLTGAPSRLLPLLLLKQCQPACSNKSYVYRYIIGFKPRFTLVLRRFEQNASTTETKCSTSLSPPEDSAESSGASLRSLSLVSLVSGRFRALQSLSLVSVVSVRADATGVPLEKEKVCLSKKSLSPFEAPREKEPVPEWILTHSSGACPSFPEGTGSFQGTKPLGKRSLSPNESPLEP